VAELERKRLALDNESEEDKAAIVSLESSLVEKLAIYRQSYGPPSVLLRESLAEIASCIQSTGNNYNSLTLLKFFSAMLGLSPLKEIAAFYQPPSKVAIPLKATSTPTQAAIAPSQVAHSVRKAEVVPMARQVTPVVPATSKQSDLRQEVAPAVLKQEQIVASAPVQVSS
jgi:hypothetical protein